ncbi:DUF4157 domain-containing protein [Nostoc sp. LEGE 12450]|uniref:eCIS core domain-containing protein n=1 Tax=Nostoc sp. LEGE 12450 TaxID=1828643 RepID=UPI001D15C44A|nr:DUF4157 domain-containing protein [Nostoc sp. LEGE 12450]
MYQKQIFQKVVPSRLSTPISKEIAPNPIYGSLSSVVQRVQEDPNSVSGDERQQLESAIGSRSTQEILAGKQTPWMPNFQGISTQLWGNSRQAPIQAKGKNQTGLPDDLKTGIENLSGIAVDDVKVHYNSSKPAQLEALAYTQGTDIHVAPGQEQHLAHEAWHVVQQKQGKVKPTVQTRGVQINDEQRLEEEADVMGAKAMMCGKSDSLSLSDGNQLVDNFQSNTTQMMTNVIQKKGDKHYWVVNSETGDEQYIGSFKSHAPANAWWKANKSDYPGYTFGQGNSATSYR